MQASVTMTSGIPSPGAEKVWRYMHCAKLIHHERVCQIIVHEMRSFIGKVSCGYGVATKNLMPVEGLIEDRMRLAPLLSGTLNLRLSEAYIVQADARISPEEYGMAEGVKLQRCLIKAPDGLFHKAIITRPESHEIENQHHGLAHFEIMGVIHFFKTWNLHAGDELEVLVEGDDNWWQSGLGEYGI